MTKKFSLLLLLMNTFIIYSWASSYESRAVLDENQWELFEEYGYFGAKNAKGKIIVPAKFSYINYENGTFTVKDNSGNIGKYTRDGKLIFPPIKYTQVLEINGMDDSPFIVLGEMWGVVDRKGKVLLKDDYAHIEVHGNLQKGYHFLLWKDGYMGVADLKGRMLIAPDKYNSIGRNVGADGKIYFTYTIYGGGSGVCNERGEQLIHTNNYITIPKGIGESAYYEVIDGNGVGKINLRGEVLEPIKNKQSRKITDVVAKGKNYSIWLNKSNKCLVKNSIGEIIIDPDFDWIGFNNNCFTVWKGKYMGVINPEGKVIVPVEDHYIAIDEITEKYVSARSMDNKQAVFGQDGKLIIPAIHKYASLDVKKIFEGNDSIISHRDNVGCWGVEDFKGNVLVPPIYDNLNFLESEFGFFFYVFKNGKVGLQDIHGNLIFEPEYKDISISTDKNFPFFFINTGNYMGITDLNGNIIINPETFKSISFNPTEKRFTGIAGKRKCVFTYEGKLISDNQRSVQREEFIDLADQAFAKDKFKDAANFYGKAIDISPSASLYFNRGVSYYNSKKYNEAIVDFHRTLNSKPSDRLRDRSIDLIDKAEHYQAVKEYNQMQLASAIFGLAMTGVNYAIQSKSKKSAISSYQSSSGSSYSSSSYSSSSDNDNTSLPKQKKKQKCGFCGGKGSTVEYVANFGIDEQPWCDECGKKVVSGHYHKTCTHCNGTGER